VAVWKLCPKTTVSCVPPTTITCPPGRYICISVADQIVWSENRRYGTGTYPSTKEGEKYFPLVRVEKINGRDPSYVRDRLSFDHLTPLFPEEKFNLTGKKAFANTSVRVVDMFSPIGKGQRGLIVSQPKTVKPFY
jgi:transcription termination factor Rho